jgi:isoleucyl-tRNA synthetase
VHEAIWKTSPFERSELEKGVWLNLFEVRKTDVLPALEIARQAKEIGKSLDGKVTLYNFKIDILAENNPLGSSPESLRSELAELCNVSQLVLAINPTNGFTEAGVSKADGQKCERCWHWETDIGQNAEHPTICGRCIEAVMQFKTSL